MRFAISWLARVAALLTLLAAGMLYADVWDSATETDNDAGTDNVPTHGMDQLHDLAALPGPAPDEDWFRLCPRSLTSYEAVVDGLTGDLSEDGSLRLDFVDSTGAVGLAATTLGVGDQNRVVRFFAAAVPCGFAYLRVSAPDCGTACDANDRYRIRFYDTTIAVPRYNNAGGQVTVLIIQNPTDYDVDVIVRLWSPAGAEITNTGSTLNARTTLITNLATLNGGIASGTAGTITIENLAGYGELAAKAIAVEPATGFSFDSPGLYRPH